MHASLKGLFFSLGHFAWWTNKKERLLIVYLLVDFLSSPYNVILVVVVEVNLYLTRVIPSEYLKVYVLSIGALN